MTTETQIIVGDKIQITSLFSTSLTKTGTVCEIKYLHVNRGMKSFGKEKSLFVSMDSYEQLLSRGLLIILKYGHLYTIEHFNYPTDNNIVVRYYNDDSICGPSDQIKTIKIEDILGMLVYHEGYTIKKI